MIALTSEDLRHHLRSALERAPGAKVVGFRAPRTAGLPETIEVSGRHFKVVQAGSELALRKALRGHRGESLMVLTPLEDRALALDVKARLARQRLFEFDPWEAARGLFKATRVDGRLRVQPALGRAVLKYGASGYAPVASGVLDETHAWEGLLRVGLAYPQEALSLSGLMVWSCAHPSRLRQLLNSDEALLTAFKEFITRRLGPAAGLWLAVTRTAEASEQAPGPFALRIGLVLDAQRAAQKQADRANNLALSQQVANLNVHLRYTSDALTPEGLESAEPFAEAARRAWARCRQEAPEMVASVLPQLDAYLKDLGLSELAQWSAVSPLGWSARLSALADLLDPGDDGEALEEALSHIAAHEESVTRPALMPRLRALARLAYRQAQGDTGPTLSDDAISSTVLGAWARWYVEEGSFEDVLREVLLGADLTTTLQDAVRRLLDLAATRRRAQQQAFAEALARTLAQGSMGPEVVPIQSVLDEVVAPLLKDTPVLVVVLDGLSWSAARALLSDDALASWDPWVPRRHRRMAPMLSTIPTITQCARTALLTGTLTPGGQAQERKGFTQHARLRKALGTKGSAHLFHKSELRDGAAGISKEVWKTLHSPKARAVAVVVNAIDDQLDGAEQLHFTWTVDAITPLRSLLDMVRGQRTVVLVGDHGHVRDDQSAIPPGISAPNARWRDDLAEGLVDGETRFTGPMIKSLTGNPEIAASWDERLRYTGRKRGYHGGASLQEVVTPLIVLAPPNNEPNHDHFTRLVTSPPDWWRLRQEEAPRLHMTTDSTVESSDPLDSEDTDTPRLFSSRRPAAAETNLQLALLQTPMPTRLKVDAWIEALLDSEAFKAQQRMTRISIPEDDIRRVLATLAANDDAAHLGTLARALTRAEHRVERLLAPMRQLLNVEGYPVLSYQRAEQTLTLDRTLLRRQFQLSDTP